ncbi:LTA synthase family protein [Mycoplasmatota bacterium zrk1]
MENIFRKSKKQGTSLLYIIVFAAGLIIIEYFNRYQIYLILEDFKFLKGISLLYSIAFLSLLSAILVIIPTKIKSVYISLIYLLVTIYMIANRVYYGLFKEFISIRQVLMLQDTHNYYSDADIFFNDVSRHFKFDYILIILFAIISSYFSIKLIKRVKKSTNRLLFLILLILFLSTSFLGRTIIYNSENAKWQIIDNKVYLYETLFRKDMSIEEFGIYGHLKRDIELMILNKRNDNDNEVLEDISTYFENSKVEKNENEYTGFFEDKNVIFILAESLNVNILNPELTPTLHMMQDTGLYFENFYVPAYPRTTCDSEFISQTGLLPSLYSGPTCYIYQNNQLPYSLPNLFKSSGYSVNSFHNNVGAFYNRTELHNSLGFERFYDCDALNIDLKIDSNIYEFGKDYILPNDKFYNFIISFSGHGGYTEKDLMNKSYYSNNYKIAEAVLEEGTPKEILVYSAYQMEFDNMLTKFYDDLSSSGRLADTVFVILSDHYPYMLEHNMYTDYIDAEYEYDYHNLPLIIWSPEVDSKTVTKIGSTYDVLPTVANMFGLDYEPGNYFGVDIMDEQSKPIVVLKDYSWLDNEYNYSSSVVNASVNQNDYYKDVNEALYEKIDVFQNILIEDYYNKRN